MFTAIRRWYHTRCIALNRAEIADSQEDKADAILEGNANAYLALTHWIDDCERSIRHHETRLNQLGPLDDDVSQPHQER